MKPTIKILSIAAMLCTTLLFTGCDKDKEKAASHMTIKMTDAPADYTEVKVEITGLEVHREGGWVSLPVNTGIYDLLTLQNDASVVLVDNALLPAGKIEQIRLILGENNTVTVTDPVTSISTVYMMDVPSGTETGLKLNGANTIPLTGHHIVIVLDFDAKASVVEHGDGTYSLKPVIKVKSINII